jgi:hypothetical protein
MLIIAHNDKGLTPVHFFSHGSTRMLEAETEAGEYWKQCGDEALAHGVKGIIILVSDNLFNSTLIRFYILLVKLTTITGRPLELCW